MYACSLRTDYVLPDPPHYLEDYVWPEYQKQMEKLKKETSICTNLSDYQLLKNSTKFIPHSKVDVTLTLIKDY